MNEKHYRSVLKGATWRLIGTFDTFILSWFFTGSCRRAAAIGGVELFTKMFLFYMHERIWLRIPWARAVGSESQSFTKEHRRRSLAKGISWRITGTLDTVIIAFFITRNPGQALSIGFTEVVTKVGLYYLHERAWNRISLGRHAVPPGR